MICPNCGAEIADDMLYCEKCGCEIQFVPNFEPEIEQSITETLSEIQLMDEEGVFVDEFGEYSEEGAYDEGAYIEGFYDDNGVYFEGYYAENGDFVLLGYYDEYGQFIEYTDYIVYEGGFSEAEAIYDYEYEDAPAYVEGLESVDLLDESEPVNTIEEPKTKVKKTNSNKENSNKENSNKVKSNKANSEKAKSVKSDKFDSEKAEKKKPQTNKPVQKIKRELGPLESAKYKRPEGLVRIAPPSKGPRLSHKLSDSLYDEMLDNEGLREHLDSLGEEYDLDPFDDFAYEGYLFRKFVKFLKGSALKWVIIPALLLVVILVIVGVNKVTDKFKQNTSADFQVQMANEAAARGDYATAIDYMEKAINLKGSDLNFNNNNTDLKYTLVDLYFKNNDEDNAILTLWDIIKSGDSNAPFAYRRILDFYVDRADYSTLNQILLGCEYPDVINEYGSYMAAAPEFSVGDGTYEEPFDLTISTTIPGFIYYTTDGTEPTEESDLYVAPIYLDMGIYRISAVFVNQYGIKSDIVTKTYTLDRRVPDPPKVMTDEGDYTSPELIEIDVQPYTRVFYTTDGTMPTMDSTEYLSPLPMPIGYSRLTFVAYSTENVAGPYTEVSYNLTVDTPLDVQGMVTYLITYDYRIGRAVDANGFIAGNSQRYTYGASQAIVVDEVIYYIYVESLVDNLGNITKTGKIYLVDTENGSIWTASKDENNVITKGDLIQPELYAPLPEESQPEEGQAEY